MVLANAAGLWAQTGTPKGQQAFATRMGSIQRWPYPAPNQDKTKFEVSWEEMTNVTEGALATTVKIKSFGLESGTPQMIAETPSCIIDFDTRQISSTNRLQARSGDGNLYIEGVGFLWQQNSTPDLALSNRVHTIIRQLAAENDAAHKTNSATSQTDVDSEWAAFDTKSGLAIYHDRVRVVDPQLNLTCAILTVQQAKGDAANQLEHIVAETNVIIDYTDQTGRKTHATSDKAVYTRTSEPATNELLTLSGNPRLETTNGWSTADIFVMNRTTGSIQGSGNCRFHSRPALESAGGNSTNAPAPPQTEITSDNFDYDMKTSVVVFRENVRVDNPQLKLVCKTLTAKLPEGNANASALDHVVAEENVAIDYLDEHGEKTHATGEKAVYSSSVVNGVTNKVLELTGNPVLERTNGWIMADLITMDLVNGTIRGEGDHHSIFKKQPGQVSKTAPPATADTEIFSDHFQYDMKTGVAFYRGNARVLDPQMKLQCRQLMVKLPAGATNGASRPERIVAETNVIVDYFSEKGEKTHATGEEMVFTHTVTNGPTTNEMLELTGKPIIDMTNLKGEKTHASGERVVYTSTTVGDKQSQLVRLSGHPRVATADGVMTSDDVITYDPMTGKGRGVGAHNHIIFTVKPSTPAKTNIAPTLSNVPRS